jgi:hypothetical protein
MVLIAVWPGVGHDLAQDVKRRGFFPSRMKITFLAMDTDPLTLKL